MDSDRSSEDNEELAQDRTDLAEDRTILAHERSYAGWVRTGMAAIGIGLGFNALFGAMEPDWAAKAIASAFLLAAGYIFLSAERRARRVLGRLDTHEVRTLKPVRIRLLSWSLTVLSLALAAAIWLLIDEQPAPPEAGQSALGRDQRQHPAVTGRDAAMALLDNFERVDRGALV